jgi:hypothetical protein
MQRVIQFAFRVSNDERRAIADLAARLQRSQSDAVRFVVIEAAKQLTQADSAPLALLAEDPKPNEGGTHVTD